MRRILTVLCPLTILAAVAFWPGAAGAVQDARSDAQCDPAEMALPDRDRQPAVRMAPNYPSRCMETAQLSESVDLIFDVHPSGATDRINVTHSTNDCFSREAVRAVMRWKYACVPNGLRGVETTMTFNLEGDGLGPIVHRSANCFLYNRSAASAEEVRNDHTLGTPCRALVTYPLRCTTVAKMSEHLTLRFDVSPEGDVTDIEIDEATDKCFKDAAKRSIKKRKFAPTSNGFKDIGAVFIFDKSEESRLPDCMPAETAAALTRSALGPKIECFAVASYPQRCLKRSNGAETVTFKFDVTSNGWVTNIRLENTSNACFVDAARTALEKSRYEKSDSGARDIETTLTFELAR